MNEANNIPQGCKDSPLGIIPNDWEVKRFGEICEVLVGKDLRESNYNPEKTTQHNIPIYSNTVDNDGLYGYYDFEEYKGKTITVVGRGVGIGTAFAREYGFGAIGRLLVLYPNKSINHKYIANYINERVDILVESAAIPQLTGVQFSSYKILLPPFPEQQKIAEILTCWDDAIEKQTRLIEKLETRKRGLMQQLLTGKKRLRGFEGEWREHRLGNLFEKITRKNSEGNTNVVTISAQRGFIKQTDFFNKKVASELLDNYFLIKRGEFCYNKSYSNGYPWGATKRLRAFEKAVVTTLYICFKIKDASNTYGDFFEHYFEANLLDKGLVQIAYEGGRAHGLLNVTPLDFFSIKIVIPNCGEQIAITNILSTADEELQKEKGKLDVLKLQKKGLMQQLLTGKKRVTYI
jgi:type I restriction enzyme S subunit